jgi:rhodanese-related sulfurtransferase
MIKLSRIFLFLLISLLLCVAVAAAGNRAYIKAYALETRFKTSQPTNIVDIQVEAEFASHHIKDALATYAYPVKSDSDKSKFEALLTQLNTNTDPIVIVCPRGAGGATRTYDYLLERGLAAERLLILEGGQAGWNSAELIEGN